MDNKKHGLKHSCHRCPLFLLAQEAQKKKLSKRKRRRDFALCGGRPKAPPLETASLLKRLDRKL
jgi:hypothetical protein